ncbi:MAG: CinA family protein [Christensenellales bacterium]
MIDNNKDLCIIKAIELTGEQVDEIMELSGDDIAVSVDVEGLDYKIIVDNSGGEEVDFFSTINAVKKIAGDKIYSEDDETLEEKVVKLALEKGVRIAVAESLTGGMICSRIVNVSGSSGVLNEGLVTYTNAAKVKRLHVKLTTLRDYGVVSEQTAKEMALGLRSKDNALVVATTGCAGPGSDADDSPVGLAYIGVAGNNGVDAYKLNLEGERNVIRKSVTDKALYLLLNYITKY